MSEFERPDIHPMKRVEFPAMSGRSKRKLKRQNTVHWAGVCPSCGSLCKYHKSYGSKERKNLKHNVWVCTNDNCRLVYSKEDFKEGKYL